MSFALFGSVALEGRAASYTNTILCGVNFIANPLAVPIYQLIPAPDEFSFLTKWNQTNQAFDEFYVHFLGAWSPGDPSLAVGESALFDTWTSHDECPIAFTVSGAESIPVLPVAFVRDSYRAISRQAPDAGTYENIVGLPPEIGAKFIRFDRNLQQWVTNLFDGSAWTLGDPAARVGEGVLIYFPPVVQPLVLTNLVFNPASGGSFSLQVIGTSNVLTRVQYSTDISGTNWITATNHAPATGAFNYTTNSTGVSGHRFYRAQYSF